MSELRECPFCGDSEDLYSHEFYNGMRWWQIKCRVCKASGGARLSLVEATDAWNTRFTPGYETPEMYKARTGKDWPDDAPVYALHNSDAGYWWQLYEFSNLHDSNWLLVCATEAGKPPVNWKPNEVHKSE